MSDRVTGAMIATAVAGAAAVVADAILMAISPNPPGAAAIVAHPAIGAVWIAAGLVAWARYPTFRTGPLMIVSGFLWLALVLYTWRGALSVTFGQPIDFFSIAVAAQLFVAFPSGRLRTRSDRLLVGGVYANAFVGGLIRQLFLGPTHDWCAGECGRNLLLVHDDPGLLRVLMACSIVVGAGLVLAIAWRLARRMRAASPAGKAVLGPVLWSGAAALLSALAVAFTAWAGGGIAYEIAVVCVWIAWGLVPVAFLIGLLRARLRRAAVTRLLLELGELPSRAHVRDALARALGDPSLELLFWSEAGEGYLTVEGAPASLPAEDQHRAVTLIDQRRERFAALVHDPFILEDRELLDAVGAAARLAIDNSKLQAELQAQLTEVRASRARIVTAGVAERRRIERDLHDGAQQRLLGIRLALRLARGRPGEEAERMLLEADEELRAALDELRALARGIHPAVLTDEGLAAALTSLAHRSTVPVDLRRLPKRRLPAAVEAAAYFVTSEGLANVAKYAEASQVTIDAAIDGERLRLEIADDGIGGADDTAGSGLRGLRDRVEALGGQFRVESPPRAGTRLQVDLPCGAPTVPGLPA